MYNENELPDNDQTQDSKKNQPQTDSSSILRNAKSEEFEGLDFDSFVKAYARKNKVPPKIVRNLMNFESSDNPEAVSAAGAEGIGQFMPATAKQYGIDPKNKWQSAIGVVNYLSDNYNKLRPIAKDDIHGWHASIASYLSGEGTVRAALKAGQYLPDGEDKYTKLPITKYVENIVSKAGGNDGMMLDDDAPAPVVQTPAVAPETPVAEDEFSADTSTHAQDFNGTPIIGENVGGDTRARNEKEQRQMVVDQFGAESAEVKEYDRQMKAATIPASNEAQTLLNDTNKGLVRDETDEARRLDAEREQSIKQNHDALNQAEQQAFELYRKTGNRAQYDEALKKTLVGSYTIRVTPSKQGGQFQINGQAVDQAQASEQAVRQLAGQFTRDQDAIEKVVADYKMRGGGSVRLFDAESGKYLDESKKVKDYTIKLPADVALSLKRSNQQFEVKQTQAATDKLSEAISSGSIEANALAKALSFNGLINQGAGAVVGMFDDKLGADIKTAGFNQESGQFFTIRPEDFGFKQGTKEYEQAADRLFPHEIAGTIGGEVVKLITLHGVLGKVTNVVAKGSQNVLGKILPTAVRVSQAGEITAASGSITGAEGFTSAAQLTSSSLESVKAVSQLIGATTSFAGLQTIAPQGWVVNTDVYGKMLGLERAVYDTEKNKGKLRKETLTDLTENFGKHWMMMALFAGTDIGVSGAVNFAVNNDATKRFLTAILVGKGMGVAEAVAAVENTIMPNTVKLLGTAASSFAYTAMTNKDAVVGVLGNKRGAFQTFVGDYLMNVATMGAMKAGQGGFSFKHPETGKVYEIGKSGNEVTLRELTGADVGINVAEPTNKLELDFLVKNYVDTHGSETQKAVVNDAFHKTYVDEAYREAVRQVATVPVSKPEPVAIPREQVEEVVEPAKPSEAPQDLAKTNPADDFAVKAPEEADIDALAQADEAYRIQNNLDQAPTEKGQIPSPDVLNEQAPKDYFKAPVNANQIREFNGKQYRLTDEQSKEFDRLAGERDAVIRAASNAPNEAELRRVEVNGKEKVRWVDPKTGEVLPQGKPAPDALRRSLAKRQADLEFTNKLNQLIGKKPDGLSTNAANQGSATKETNAESGTGTGAGEPVGTDGAATGTESGVTGESVPRADERGADGTGTRPASDPTESSASESKAATKYPSKPINLNGKAVEIVKNSEIEQDGVVKVRVKDARGNRFYVDKDIVDEAINQPLFRREELPVHPDLLKEAQEYTASLGKKYDVGEYHKPNEEALRKIGELHEDLPHEPNSPEVKKAYDALKKETLSQFDFLTNKGVHFEAWDKEGQPYQTSKEMRDDVVNNKHLYFFTGGDMPSDHPLKEQTGIKSNGIDLTYNDVFRAVHDYFGHAVNGSQFGARGEFNATDSHARMFSDTAVPAMVGETVFQNSYVNYGRHLRRPDGTLPIKGDPDYVHPADRPYAEQKALNITPELMKVWKESYGDSNDSYPLKRVSITDPVGGDVKTVSKVRDRIRKAVTDFKIGYHGYEAEVSKKGFVQAGDDHIFYDPSRADQVARASEKAYENGELEFPISASEAGAVTLPPEVAKAIGRYIGEDFGAILRGTTKPVALINYESANRALNYHHETTHILTTALPLSGAAMKSLYGSKEFENLRNELSQRSQYGDASTYELAQEALAFAVTGDAKTFGRELSNDTLNKAAKLVFKELAKENPDLPIGELKKLALGIGREVVKDFQAAAKTAKSLGVKADREYLLRRSEELSEVPQDVFEDAKAMSRVEFNEKYRDAFPFSTRKALYDSIAQEGKPKEVVPVESAKESKTWNLEHYSREERTVADPTYAGSANAGKETLRKDRVPVTYYYLSGTKPETIFSNYHKHSTQADLTIYNLSQDKLNLREQFSGDASKIEAFLNEKGFDGYWSPEQDADQTYRNIVAVFKPLELKRALFRKSSDIESEAESSVLNGDYVILSGNQSEKQTGKDVKRTASLKAELERKGFTVFPSEENYLGTKENSLFVQVRSPKERDLLNAIAGAYKQKQIFAAKSGSFTAPVSSGKIGKENYSKTNNILFGAEALKQDGYTKVRLGETDVVFSVPDLYENERSAKLLANEAILRAAIENQDKFFAKAGTGWHLLDRTEKGLIKGSNVVEAVQNLENYYQKVHPMQGKTVSEKVGRYVSDNVETVKQILDKGLYDKDWYSDDMKRMFASMEEAFPEVNTNKAAQQAFGLLLAITSPRMTVTANYGTAAKIFTRFLKTLEVPRFQESGSEYGIFGSALDNTNKLLSGHVVTKNADGGFAMKFSPEFKRDIDKRGMQAVFDYLASPSEAGRYFNSQELYGMKVGSFLLNLNGNAYVPTIDSWMMRSWNVVNGGSVKMGKNKKTGEPELVTVDIPNESQADILRGSMQSISRRLNEQGYEITPVEVQALIWMHYRNLVNKATNTNAGGEQTFSGAAEKNLAKNKELGGTFNKFTAKFGSEAGVVSKELGKDLYLKKPETTSRIFFRKESDDAAGRDDFRDKLFYSTLSRSVEAKLPNSFTKEQLIGFLNNPSTAIKKDEIIWSGIPEFLKQAGDKITKQEVLDYVNENRVKIYEKTSNSDLKVDGDFDSSYGTYSTKAGSDYREILIKADGIDTYSKHYGEEEEHIIASARIKTLNQEGKKVLMVEEIQSDHHQEGRKKGYRDGVIDPDSFEKSKKEARRIIEEEDRLGFDSINQAMTALKEDYNSGRDWKRTWDLNRLPEESLRSLENYLELLKGDSENAKLPSSAPFAKNWHEVTFRRLLKYAADNGYDKIAWTSGDVQAERYSLDKYFDEVRYNKQEGILQYRLKGQSKITGVYGKVTPEKLAEHVGEDVAKKLMSAEEPNVDQLRKEVKDLNNRIESEPNYERAHELINERAGLFKKINDSGNVTIQGSDLKDTGGDGMRGFYDKMLVSYGNKIGKQLGSKVEPYQVETLEKEKFYTLEDAEENTIGRFKTQEEAGQYAANNNLVGFTPIVDLGRVKVPYHSMQVTPKFGESTALFRKESFMREEEDWLREAERSKNQPLTDKEVKLIKTAYQTGATERELYEIADKMQMSIPRFLIKLYKANLLSAIGTTISNTASNTVMQILEEVMKVPAAAADIANSKITGAPRTVQGASVKGVAYGLRGLKVGFSDFVKDVVNENPDSPYAYYSKSGIKPLDNTVGRAADLVIRFVGGQDKIFSGYAVKRAAYEAAALRVKNEGISLKEALENPTLEDSDMALRYGLYTTFNENNKVNDLYTDLKKAAYDHAAPLGWFLDTKVPFVRTGSNIFFTTLDYLGVNGTLRGLNGVAKSVDRASWEQTKKNIAEGWSQPEVRREANILFGRGLTGLGIAYLAFQAAASGLVKINSYYDDDDFKDMNRRANDNSNPMSIKIGGKWYGFGRLSPIGTFVAAGAAMYQASKGDKEAGLDFAKQFGQTLPLGKAAGDLVDLKLDKDKPFWAYLFPDAASMIPMSGLLRDVANTGDVKRQTKVKGDWIETQKNKVKEIIPTQRETLPVKTSSLGYEQDVPNVFKGFSTNARENTLLRELEKIDWQPEGYNKSEGREFTQAEKLERRKLLEDTLNSEAYKALTNDEDRKYAFLYALKSLTGKKKDKEKEVEDSAAEKSSDKAKNIARKAIQKILKDK